MEEKKSWRSVAIGDSDEYGVAHIFLNRPSKGNALDASAFSELPIALRILDERSDVSVILLCGSGKHFCSGIDLATLGNISSGSEDDGGDKSRQRHRLHSEILKMQASISAIELCRKPVIAVIHGACIGGGVDVITACDLRYCTANSLFSVKEVDLAITADLGSLQRLPKIVGNAKAMELALTAKDFNGLEAKAIGLVNDCYSSEDELKFEVMKVARAIASKPMLAVVGTKRVVLKSRDMSVEEGLGYVAVWNAAMLSSDDLSQVMISRRQKSKPVFSKL